MFFFFQAEDGIRDIGVTGVQTCALPISGLPTGRSVHPFLHRPARRWPGRGPFPRPTSWRWHRPAGGTGDRKSVVEGKRVDLGGRRIIKKKKNTISPLHSNFISPATPTYK